MIRLLAVLLACAVAFGCDDETTEGEAPAVVQLPDDPDPEYDEGNWSKAQRGLALDRHDVAVIRPSGDNIGLTPDRIAAGFERIVLNRLLVEFIQAPRPDEASRYLPLAKAEDAVAAVEGAGVTVGAVAVNVALLNPNGKALLHVELQSGAPKARFDVLEHRGVVLDAMRDLAGLDNLTHVTVGFELNRYYHLEDADSGEVLQDDYSNLVTLYREVYRALKAAEPDLRVGPGVSWAFFQNRTVRQMVVEYGLEDDEGGLSEQAELEAVVRAYQRTIRPLVVDPNSGEKTADYLGLSVLPFVSQAPFAGSPGPERPEMEPDAFAPIAAYYRHVRYVAGDLPVVLARIDWPTETKLNARNKAVFLTNLKRALSHVEIEWAAWRRTSDLPEVQLSNTCAQEKGLGHPVDYCYAGMLDENGEFEQRAVLDNLLTDP